ncbi:cobalt transporter subunit CbtB [Amaricoccus macauensis]|uniref:Cobalt transporter subunit CbtB n=1 Tax=Amaricoccus macauensis TaxID=57001 RepID=A0A840SW48_9RHOB|nr:CbtB-domain containing protein [Amaricoccus macauensis]MBB5224036.1 cobalt transporter subunit CbtB [Amaricoccus macauensis]
MATTSSTSASASSSSLVMPRLIAAALGAFIVGMVGFSHMTVAHNAGHDFRHSMAFPCH